MFFELFLVASGSVLSISSGYVFTDIDLSLLREKQMLRGETDPEELKLYDTEERISLIYPGTKWCGPGDVADSYDDLGTSVEADMCCREHDNCPETIVPGEAKHNLTNDSYYTKLSCACDETFRKCLRAATTKTADQIGTLYFNLIGQQCYREDYPVVGCAKKSGLLKTKCVKYVYNYSGDRLYQWFDVPNYLGKMGNTKNIRVST